MHYSLSLSRSRWIKALNLIHVLECAMLHQRQKLLMIRIAKGKDALRQMYENSCKIDGK